MKWSKLNKKIQFALEENIFYLFIQIRDLHWLHSLLCVRSFCLFIYLATVNVSSDLGKVRVPGHDSSRHPVLACPYNH